MVRRDSRSNLHIEEAKERLDSGRGKAVSPILDCSFAEEGAMLTAHELACLSWANWLSSSLMPTEAHSRVLRSNVERRVQWALRGWKGPATRGHRVA